MSPAFYEGAAEGVVVDFAVFERYGGVEFESRFCVAQFGGRILRKRRARRDGDGSEVGEFARIYFYVSRRVYVYPHSARRPEFDVSDLRAVEIFEGEYRFGERRKFERSRGFGGQCDVEYSRLPVYVEFPVGVELLKEVLDAVPARREVLPEFRVLRVGQAAHHPVYVRRGELHRPARVVDFFDFYAVVGPAYGEIPEREGVGSVNPAGVPRVGIFERRPADVFVARRLVKSAVRENFHLPGVEDFPDFHQSGVRIARYGKRPAVEERLRFRNVARSAESLLFGFPAIGDAEFFRSRK